MMPEYGHALLCLALGVALQLSVYPLWGVARGDARMMASAGVFAWLLFICVAGAFFVLVHALWLTTSPWPMSPATRTRSCRCGTGCRHLGGARGLAAAVGAADERLDPGGGGVQPAGAGGYRPPGCWR
ncbi:Cytochrome c heme lyase subunit CcmF [Salmonella enterica subsp. enterica]|uniref:Cytochrome c heme lyase subunit CcmF n=1 Tax=Salmonella enterica I TaxID=59201 RepID=A0A379UY52_SALET|nr:Cytochrome c heme lyase subunit CcmF [Salmonella enterica subsp. enterica]